MMEYIDISILNPAEYNPRLLTNEAQEDLKKSIKELGIIKPIIIRQSDKRIMAGHQRTKTMKLLGYTHVPAFILDAKNFTANFRFGEWYFQHYHSTADIIRLNTAYIGKDFNIFDKGMKISPEKELRGSSFQVASTNGRSASKNDYLKALQYEFTLPLPNNRKWDLDKEIIPIFKTL